jgi:hypothetical protein
MKSRLLPRVATVGLMVFLLMSAVIHPPVEPSAGATSPAQASTSGLFRITLNGFTVENESDDDIIEGDGKRDEIFITADVWELDGTGRIIVAPRRVTSLVMGDIFGPGAQVRAGNGGDGGGLRTGDQVPSRPTRDPWRRTDATRTDGRIPMVLAQVRLVSRRNVVVVAPIIWEWDSPESSKSQERWNRVRNELFTATFSGGYGLSSPSGAAGRPSDWGGLINWPAGIVPVFPLVRIRMGNSKPGTRPIGWGGEAGVFTLPADSITPQAVALSFEGAVEAARSDSGNGPGLLKIRYADQNDHGVYTLFIQIERLQ